MDKMFKTPLLVLVWTLVGIVVLIGLAFVYGMILGLLGYV